MYTPHFIHSSTSEYLGCFHFLVNVNNAAKKMGMQISVHFLAFNFKSKNARTYDNSILNFLNNYHIVFHGSCTILYSYQLCTRIPIFPHPCHCLFFVFVLIVPILIGDIFLFLIDLKGNLK